MGHGAYFEKNARFYTITNIFSKLHCIATDEKMLVV